MTTERRYTDEEMAEAKATLFAHLPEDEQARLIAKAEFDREVARLKAMSPAELTAQVAVYTAITEGRRQANVAAGMASRRQDVSGMSELQLKQLLVMSDARETVERNALVDDAWSECKSLGWTMSKQAAAVRYVWTLTKKYPYNTLTRLTGADLRDMVHKAGTGYDAFIAERRASKVRGMKVTAAGPVRVTKAPAAPKAPAVRKLGRVSQRDLARAVPGE